jgi:hypothetical protein
MKTTRQWVGSLVVVALFGLFVGVGASSAHAQKVKKNGWWIRVNPEKTSATTVWLKIGMTKKDSKLWRTWKTGQALEFDVPVELRNAARLYIHGTTDPHDRHALFCVFYMDHGVEQFHFDGNVDHNMKPSDSDGECKP